jgi:hypothetical protein
MRKEEDEEQQAVSGTLYVACKQSLVVQQVPACVAAAHGQ